LSIKRHTNPEYAIFALDVVMADDEEEKHENNRIGIYSK